jgi:probable rRNA maturation factor
MPAKLPALELSVQYSTGKVGLPARHSVRRFLRHALSIGLPDGSVPIAAEVTVRFVDSAEGRTLNHDYRGKDYATNVLSFPYVQEPPVIVGDLALCPEVAAREAAEQGKTPHAHLAHLLIHGMLHLMGYDHETGEADCTLMESHETQLLATLGYPDPYV